jgi:hypothetical protein
MVYIRRYWISVIGLILFAIILVPTHSSSADAIAPTYIDFHFYFNGKNISILGGKLLLCSDESCHQYEEYNKGTFDCMQNNCIAIPNFDEFFVNNFGDYNKIIISFTDKTRESNVFPFQGKVECYDVQVEKDKLIVSESNPPLSSFVDPNCFTGAAFLTIVVETIVAAIYIKIIKIQKSFLLLVVLANIISLPIVWFFFRQIINNNVVYWIVSEVFAVAFEAAFMFLFGRKYGISAKHASILSLVMNTASFLSGLVIVYGLSLFTRTC